MEIFARLMAILLVGALPALCISLAKTTAKVVGKNADNVVVSKVGRELTEPAPKTGQIFKLRLSRNPKYNGVHGLIERAVIRTADRAFRNEKCENGRQVETSSEQCDPRDQPTKARDLKGKAH